MRRMMVGEVAGNTTENPPEASELDIGPIAWFDSTASHHGAH